VYTASETDGKVKLKGQGKTEKRNGNQKFRNSEIFVPKLFAIYVFVDQTIPKFKEKFLGTDPSLFHRWTLCLYSYILHISHL
jgi:hypothetical protein